MGRHQHLYNAQWRRRRDKQLRDHPLCRLCMEMRGVVTPATVADHIIPHRGDPVKFQGPLQSVCKPCHDGWKQEMEKSGTFSGCDLHGMPLDPNHPWRREIDAEKSRGGK